MELSIYSGKAGYYKRPFWQLRALSAHLAVLLDKNDMRGEETFPFPDTESVCVSAINLKFYDRKETCL